MKMESAGERHERKECIVIVDGLVILVQVSRLCIVCCIAHWQSGLFLQVCNAIEEMKFLIGNAKSQDNCPWFFSVFFFLFVFFSFRFLVMKGDLLEEGGFCAGLSRQWR